MYVCVYIQYIHTHTHILYSMCLYLCIYTHIYSIFHDLHILNVTILLIYLLIHKTIIRIIINNSFMIT